VFKHIAFEAAKGKKISGKSRFPIFISLKDLERKKVKISDYVISFFHWLDFEAPREVTEQLLIRGKCIILLDGLDEVDLSFRREVLNEFSDITYKYPNNVYCINARPYCLKAALNNFRKWEIKPLEYDEQIKFIENWYSNISSEKGKDLVSKIREYPEILSVGSSPFYLSLICALHLNGLDVYKRSEELIDRCVDGILGQWDNFRLIARKSILKEFSINQRKIIASNMAATLFDQGKLIFTINDLVQSNSLNSLNKKFRVELPDEEKLVISLYNDFSIITKQSPSLYSYSHLSIQEYLTAIYIRDNRRELDVAHKLFNDDKYINVLLYLIRLLPDTSELLKRFLHYLDLSNLSHIRKTIEILDLQPICNQAIINKFLNEIVDLLKQSERKTKNFIKFNLVTNKIELLIDYDNANKQLADAISVITSSDEDDPELIESLFETKEEFNFFGKIAICLASLKELLNVYFKNKKEVRQNKKYPYLINQMIVNDIKTICSVEYVKYYN
jgi:predicted NACHT family NTPase